MMESPRTSRAAVQTPDAPPAGREQASATQVDSLAERAGSGGGQPGGETPEAPCAVRTPGRSRLGWYAEIALVLGLAIMTVLVLRHQSTVQGVTVDESRWIATSEYFWITILDRDVFGPDWRPNYIVLTHPPVARYLIGFGLWLQGWTPDQLNGRFDNDHNFAWNRAAGNIPSPELLADARATVLVFAVGAVVLLYLIGRLVAGPVAGATVVVLTVWNPLLSTLWTRALAEAMLAFFSLLALLLAMLVAPRLARGKPIPGTTILMGSALALATATKLSGVMGVLGVAMFAVLQAASELWHHRRLPRWPGWLDAALAAIIVFTAVNPLLYVDPIGRTLMLFDHRLDEMEDQAAGAPRLAVSSEPSARIQLVQRRVFNEFGTISERTEVPVDAALAIVGLATTILATWDALRRGAPPGPLTLLLCWSVSTFTISIAALGFNSTHYYAPLVTISVMLGGIAAATLVRWTPRVVRLLAGVLLARRTAAQQG